MQYFSHFLASKGLPISESRLSANAETTKKPRRFVRAWKSSDVNFPSNLVENYLKYTEGKLQFETIAAKALYIEINFRGCNKKLEAEK